MRLLATLIAPLFITVMAGMSAPLAAADDAPSDAAPRVEIIDQAGILSHSDKELLTTEATTVGLPDTVSHIAFLTFAQNKDNFNDTVVEYSEKERQDFLSGSNNKWAPGLLIVGIGMDPQRMGVYCGDDVCSAIEMFDDGRLDGILDEMEPALKQEKWAVGLLDGAKASADLSARRDTSNQDFATLWDKYGVLAIVIAVISVLLAWIIGKAAQDVRKRTRKQLAYLKEHQATMAMRLDELDVRAHSLSSPLAGDALRREWETIRDNFVKVHGTAHRYNADLSDSIRGRQKEISEAYNSLRLTENAAQTINAIFEMEHGDADTRRAQLTELHGDIRGATLEASQLRSPGSLEQDLKLLEQRVVALRDNLDLDTAQFMDLYVGIVEEYGTLTEFLRTQLYKESEVPESRHSTPRLGDYNYRPGMNYYVPYAVIHDWHTSDYQTYESAKNSSSSTATTSYSSSSFSGGGGSRGF